MSARTAAHQFFQNVAATFKVSRILALCRADGLGLMPILQQMTDPLLLPFAAEMTARYFQPKPGDVFLLNDPYSGGSDLAQICLVGCVRPQWFAVDRMDLKPTIRLTHNMDQEGVRIPPTPLFIAGELNTMVLAAIRAHPLCPEDFDRQVPAFLERFRAQLDTLGASRSWKNMLADEPAINGHIDTSLSAWRERLRELHPAEATEEIVLDDRSRIRLKTIVKNGEVTFDFAGTSAGNAFNLTDRATAGVCFSTLLLLLEWKGPYHSRLSDCIKVQTPMSSMVNNRFPAALSLGLRDGVGLIALLVQRTLRHIDKSLSMAESHPSHCGFSLTFAGERNFYDTAEPGTPATTNLAGMGGHSVWRQLGLQPSVERIESLYPLRYQILSYRANSAGKGLFEGGSGLTKMIELLEPGTLRWQMIPYGLKAEGVAGGKAGAPPEMAIIRKGHHDHQKLGFAGEMELAAGDQVVVQSAGGGAYGEIAAPT